MSDYGDDMNPQSAPQEHQQKIELRLRSIRTLWIALLLSIGMYYVFTIIMDRPENVPNDRLFVVFLALALSTIIVSFPVKNSYLNKAAEQQNMGLVQSGYVVALAFCEVPALLGVLDFFLTGNRYYYILFILAACGQLLHFPRREHLINASFKSR